MTTAIVQFAKTPELGSVKTRLTPTLTDEQALQLHKNLVKHVMHALNGIEGSELQLWSTSGGDFLDALSQRAGCKHYTQQGQNLGERLYHAAKTCLEAYAAVILVGSDCPYLESHHIERVRSGLDDHHAVIIPARDGGYVLFAMKYCHSKLFADIAWGSNQVLRQTLDAIDGLGLKFKLLEALDDIDRIEDVRTLGRHAGLNYLVRPLAAYL